MVVVCDSFNYEDYPVFVMSGMNAHEVASEYNSREMSKVMEVYNLGMDMEQQLSTFRCFNF